MHQIRQRKLFAIIIVLAGVAVASALILAALRRNIDLYYTPQQLLLAHIKEGKRIKLGGLVQENSIIKSKKSLKVQFVITDYKASIKVVYQGVLPALFRESKGVIVAGRMQGGHFIATQVLAKHDENYRPPEITDEALNHAA